MGRAGGGGGMGGHSGGGHSMGGMGGMGGRPGGSMGGRSGGGSRPGGSTGGRSGGGSRPGGSTGGHPGGAGGPRPGGPGGPPPGGRPPRRGWWGGFPFWPFRGYGYGGYGYHGAGCGGCLIPFIIVIAVLIVIGLAATGVTRLGNSVRYGFAAFSNSGTIEEDYVYDEPGDRYTDMASPDLQDTATSDSDRERIDTDITFSSDCILDELGWVEDPEVTGESLKAFYDATGIQPYVYFRAYDASLTTDAEKEDFAFDWYDDNIDNESTFLYIYFAEEDSDNDIGYMVYVNGYDIDSVMDEEAVEIFWDYVDEYWYSDLSTDDMLTAIFTSTADAIMP